MVQLKKKDRLFYARIIPRTRIYEVCELIIRTIEDTYFVAIDKKDKHAYLFTYEDIDIILFAKRDDALSKILIKSRFRTAGRTFMVLGDIFTVCLIRS